MPPPQTLINLVVSLAIRRGSGVNKNAFLVEPSCGKVYYFNTIIIDILM